MTHFTALLDACVLYPAPVRDLLLELSLTDLYRARWSDQIHEEWIRSVLEKRPDLQREQLERTRDLMNRSVPDCLVTGYEPLVPGLELPDPDEFIIHQFHLSEAAVCLAVKNVRARLRRPPKSVDEYLGKLEQVGLAGTVDELRAYAEML